eukprot:COSAG02_NODE_422_length_22587_cov_10.209089_29_plen_46_part_00
MSKCHDIYKHTIYSKRLLIYDTPLTYVDGSALLFARLGWCAMSHG